MNSSEHAETPTRKPRSKGCLLILLLLVVGFGYFGLKIWRYDPHRVIDIRKSTGYDAIRFQIQDLNVVLLIGVGMPPESTRETARELVGGLIDGKHIRIETDVQETSREKRLLAYVYVNVRGGQKALDERLTRSGLPTGLVVVDEGGEVFINELIIRLGFARNKPEMPNLMHQTRLAAAEAEAKQASLGMWQTDSPDSVTP